LVSAGGIVFAMHTIPPVTKKNCLNRWYFLVFGKLRSQQVVTGIVVDKHTIPPIAKEGGVY